MDKPRVCPKPSPNFDFRRQRKINAIILHHTGSNNCCGDIAWLRNPSSGFSAHYLVDRDGRIYQLVAEKDRAWHAGQGVLNGETVDLDECSIGIKVVNDGSGTPYTERQYETLEQLVAYLVLKYRIPQENVKLHRDVVPGRKNDLSSNFDFWRIPLTQTDALTIERQVAGRLRQDAAAPQVGVLVPAH